MAASFKLFNPIKGMRGAEGILLTTRSEPETDGLVFRFGLIADIQHADEDTGFNFARTTARYYRDTVQSLETAVAHWNEIAQEPKGIRSVGKMSVKIFIHSFTPHPNLSNWTIVPFLFFLLVIGGLCFRLVTDLLCVALYFSM
jgi:hypothetical protein